MSKQYRKKPVVIEAFQWLGDFDALEAWFSALGYEEDEGPQMQQEGRDLYIHELEDGPLSQVKHYASHGDWIIRGVQGEFYACKPDIFEATYEAVTS